MFRYTLLVALILLMNALGWTNGIALGTACAKTEDCDKTTNPHSSCPLTGTKTCRCDTGYTQQRGMCKANLDTACEETADCDTTTNPNSSCPATGTKSCRCDTGYTQQRGMCKATDSSDSCHPGVTSSRPGCNELASTISDADSCHPRVTSSRFMSPWVTSSRPAIRERERERARKRGEIEWKSR
ncbi:hypothetical protein DPMN_153296 [Dreissena polymorpha]|uniref:Uncharacterized protein n=1 Tax=Dreissena polymorpha TaxID=45954 RepID=A0A9D4J857_DREPO|nr:hypothetical protein DPMN_153296 [Dreissena polymorpha]